MTIQNGNFAYLCFNVLWCYMFIWQVFMLWAFTLFQSLVPCYHNLWGQAYIKLQTNGLTLYGINFMEWDIHTVITYMTNHKHWAMLQYELLSMWPKTLLLYCAKDLQYIILSRQCKCIIPSSNTPWKLNTRIYPSYDC